jgi:hypothetical protein
MTAIFEREHKDVELRYYEKDEEYEVTVMGENDTAIILYFDKNGRYKGCIGENNA